MEKKHQKTMEKQAVEKLWELKRWISYGRDGSLFEKARDELFDFLEFMEYVGKLKLNQKKDV